MPGVIGCVDGTLVSMVRPRANEDRFYCRKGYHARNVMLITDADMNILHVDVTYGGATHDSFIFNNNDVRKHLEDLCEAGEVVYLLGDSGYPQRSYLMTPVAGAAENTPEAYYNKLHASARNSVERTIGLLKGRFRCLLVHRVLQYHPDIVAKIVVACCVLHNICNRAGLPEAPLAQDEINRERTLIGFLAERESSVPLVELVLGRAARDSLISRLWQSRL